MASPSASPSPVVTPTPSPTSEVRAIEAAVRYYYDGFNRARRAADPQQLAAGSSPTCNCRSAVKLLGDLLERGRVEGNEVTVRSVRVVESARTNAVARVQYVAAPGRLVDASGLVLTPLQGEPTGNSVVVLEKRGPGWIVASVNSVGGRG